ncbi:hypothetical protein NHF50_09885 [Flavobacterium sp. NRK F10]|uniref:Uncharacterized protein n=1 Tax=Flavobacterium sediminis TaxID=2201181 RepID=A0A2U8QW84_9FLAO|nr:MULTISPECIES: hypothetical protein [Flavobacterium]AWM14156.1 hypothetical protein DI487_10060 [Flavobacterium sediminis]MCO6175352.1 hypothetical protein [Flavobacterium sp. NRK F10]
MYNHKKVNRETVYLLPFLVLTFAVSIFDPLNQKYFRISTTIWYRFYCLIEFFTVLYFYYKLLDNKKIAYFFGILYFLVYAYLLKDFSFDQKVYDDMPINMIMVLMVVTLSVQWFVEVFKKMDESPLYDRPVFYYISVFLVFYCGTFLVLLMADYLRQEKLGITSFWVIIALLNVITKIVLLVVILKSRSKKTLK